MERNIMRNLAQGVFGPVPKPEDEERDGLGQLRVNGLCDNSSIIKNNLVQNESAKGKTARPTRAVRTISSMDQNVLAELTRVDKENMHLGVSCPASVSKQQRVSPTSVIVTGNRFEFCDPTMFIRDAHRRSATDSTVSSDDEEEKERAIAEVERVAQEMAQLELSPASGNSNSEPRNESAIACATGKLNRPILRKRNTCSTLYVGSTMSAPDKDSTIKVNAIIVSCLYAVTKHCEHSLIAVVFCSSSLHWAVHLWCISCPFASVCQRKMQEHSVRRVRNLQRRVLLSRLRCLFYTCSISRGHNKLLSGCISQISNGGRLHYYVLDLR